MKHNDLAHMAKIGSDFINELASKHEEGEFLLHLTSQNPHLHKKTQELLNSYCDLIAQLSSVFRKAKDEHRLAEFEVWLDRLQKNRNLETQLYYDVHHTDIGSH
jgi:hypothetical protein